MSRFKFVLAAFALAGSLSLSQAPAYAWSPWSSTEDLGQRSSVIDSGDEITSKEVVSVASPQDGVPSIAVKQTVRYKHSRFLRADQVYFVRVDGTAEYVDRLGYWMYKDAQGKLYRFSKGSSVGTETARQTVDIGTQSTMISTADRGVVIAVSAASACSSNDSCILNVIYRYTHVDNYLDLSYTVASQLDASYVPLQGAQMAWVGGTLYKVDASGKVEALREKPSVNIGVRTDKISPSDRSVSWQPSVTAGPVSFNGRTRMLYVNRDYEHDETFQVLRYTLRDEEIADYVYEQNAHMSWIENNLYRVRVGSDDVIRLSSKPVLNIGERQFKLDNNDSLNSVTVTPVSLSSDNRAIIVNVRHNWRHSEKYQIKEYYGEKTEIARYNENLKVWTLIVDGRIYAITFDGDVVNDGSVVVVKAPDKMKRPDVIVVRPNGEDPPVVVPKKRPVEDEDPPVVVPSKRKPPVVRTDDEDGPPVVVPRR